VITGDVGGLAICVGLSVVGSLSYILGIMALALPAFNVENKRGGEPYPRWAELSFLGLYAVGQGGALVLPLIASWYGPTSIQLPVYQASMLLWNLVLMSALGMENFKKNQHVGTEVIVVATVMLIDAGPVASSAQDEAAFAHLGTTALTLAWMGVLCALWLFSAVGMVQDARGKVVDAPNTLLLIYVLAQGIGTSATTSLGKLLSLADGNALVAVGALYGLAGLTNTLSSVIAAKKLNQAEFIPFASVCSLLLNQVSGLLLWEDWRTIKLWVSYTGIHVLIVLGIYDLSSAGSELIDYAAQVRESYSTSPANRIRKIARMSGIIRGMQSGLNSRGGKAREVL